MSSYDQAASAKWANVWLLCIVIHLICIRWGLLGIERAIRESAPVILTAPEVTR